MKTGRCKRIKGFLKNIDLFGISFSFKYNEEEKYSSLFGAIVCSILYLLAIIFFTFKLIPFLKKKIIVYTSIQ